MTDDGRGAIERAVQVAAAGTGVPFEVVPCDPALADTAAFCEAYGYAMEDSANCVVVLGKGEPPRHVACVVLATTRLDAAQKPAARRLIAAGALTFLASDSILGFRKFVLDDPHPVVEGAVMATYTGAQLLLSEGAGRL